MQQHELQILQYLTSKLTRRSCHMCDFLKADMPDELLRSVEAQSTDVSDMTGGAMGYAITLLGDSLNYNMRNQDDEDAAASINALVSKLIEVFMQMYGEVRDAFVSHDRVKLARIDETEIYVKSHILVLTPLLRDMGKYLQWPMDEF